jgi:hypothetical protein
MDITEEATEIVYSKNRYVFWKSNQSKQPSCSTFEKILAYKSDLAE